MHSFAYFAALRETPYCYKQSPGEPAGIPWGALAPHYVAQPTARPLPESGPGDFLDIQFLLRRNSSRLLVTHARFHKIDLRPNQDRIRHLLRRRQVHRQPDRNLPVYRRHIRPMHLRQVLDHQVVDLLCRQLQRFLRQRLGIEHNISDTSKTKPPPALRPSARTWYTACPYRYRF